MCGRCVRALPSRIAFEAQPLQGAQVTPRAQYVSARCLNALGGYGWACEFTIPPGGDPSLFDKYARLAPAVQVSQSVGGSSVDAWLAGRLPMARLTTTDECLPCIVSQAAGWRKWEGCLACP
jgi:hypothetical protein